MRPAVVEAKATATSRLCPETLGALPIYVSCQRLVRCRRGSAWSAVAAVQLVVIACRTPREPSPSEAMKLASGGS
jgi:hypothetical protein